MDDSKKTSQPGSVEELKTKGNECVKDGKFIEAVLHYTQAIKLDPNNYVLYSNRSFAFLKLDQHYLSLQDANETVRLQPQWAKVNVPQKCIINYIDLVIYSNNYILLLLIRTHLTKTSNFYRGIFAVLKWKQPVVYMMRQLYHIPGLCSSIPTIQS